MTTKPIKINPSPTADTRTCDYKKITKLQLKKSSQRHIEDVGLAMDYLCQLLKESAAWHDRDKIEDIDGFYKDFQSNFSTTEWWEKHQRISRHHMSRPETIPDDVNLIDILEMVADCVMAALGRNGEYRPSRINPDLLVKAYDNTAKLLIANTEIVEDRGE